MKFMKLALTMAMLGIAAATYATAQVLNQSTSVSKPKISSSVEKSAEPQHYELRCRGGVTYHSDNTYHIPAAQKLDFFFTEGQPKPEATNVRMMNMQVNFIPTAQGAGSTGASLEPGQCAWLDRGFRADEEPFIIRQQIVYFGQLYQLQHGLTIDSSPAAAEQYSDSRNVPEYLKDETHYWSFFVRYVAPASKKLPNGSVEDWNGYFEAVSSRYWKPVDVNQEIRTPRSKVPAEVKKPRQ